MTIATTATVAALPAVDEYTARTPTADGKQAPAEPGAGLSQLRPATRAELRRSDDGTTLGAIAATAEGAAPVPVAAAGRAGSDSPDGRGLLSASTSALSEPIGIAFLLGALGALGALAVALRHRGQPR